VLQDLAEVQTLQRELERAESLAELGRMSAVVAHEIRNPLGGVEGFAKLLQQDLRDPTQKRYADMVVQGLGELNRLVNNLLEFSRAPKLTLEEIDLPALLENLGETALMDLRNGAAAGAPCRFDLHAAAGFPLLLADRTAMRQVFLNLIRNGLEAMAEHRGGTLRVHLDQTEMDGCAAVRVDVQDQGSGIPEKMRGTLFQPFVTTKKTGTGLGLPTVAKLITAHGGTVQCVQASEGGACFRVLLPLNASVK